MCVYIHAGLACKRRIIVWVDFLGQVDVQKVNKEKLFAKKHPSAAKQITSYRELEAGLPILLSCSYLTPTLNVLWFFPIVFPHRRATFWLQNIQVSPWSTRARTWGTSQCWSVHRRSFIALRHSAGSREWFGVSRLVLANMFLTLWDLRPQGKFLATGRGRYLLGRETMLLMGLPVHRLNLKGCSENVPCLHVLDMWACCETMAHWTHQL